MTSVILLYVSFFYRIKNDIYFKTTVTCINSSIQVSDFANEKTLKFY